MTKQRKRDPLYIAFMSMKSRCNSPTCRDFPYYGARGISICPEWENFEAFREWSLANGYAPGLTLDRENTNGNYHPDNCRWATRKTQARNRRPFRSSSSNFIGVSWNAQYSKWTATVCVDNKNKHLGRFDDEVDAARARDAYVIANGLTEYTLNFK